MARNKFIEQQLRYLMSSESVGVDQEGKISTHGWINISIQILTILLFILSAYKGWVMTFVITGAFLTWDIYRYAKKYIQEKKETE